MYNSVKAKSKQVKATEVNKEEFEKIIKTFLEELQEEIENETSLSINIKVEYLEKVN